MLLVGHHTILQSDALSEASVQHLAQQVDKVLLQVLVYKGAGYLYEYHLLSFIKLLEDDRLEPCIVYLLGDVLAYERKRLVPTSIRTWLHVDRLL